MSSAPHRLVAESDEEFAQRLSDFFHAENERYETLVDDFRTRDSAQAEARRRDLIADTPRAGSLGRTAESLLAEVPKQITWLVPGLLAPGWTTKLAAREKVGKGVFSANLLGCVERGEPTPFGPACEPTTAMIFTEEPEDVFREKLSDAGLRRAFVVGHELASHSWDAKVNYLLTTAVEQGHGVIWIDNVSRATGVTGQEENDSTLGQMVARLGDVARAADVAVLLNHHHKKGAASIYDKSRGGTALAAAVDVDVEMERLRATSRVRKLTSVGRVKATCWIAGVELSDDGRTYSQVPLADDDDADDREQSALTFDLMALRRAGGRATPAQFAEAIGVQERQARRRLDALVAEELAEKVGTRPTIYAASESVGHVMGIGNDMT